METVTDFIFLGSHITADGDCRHQIKRCLLLGWKAMTNLDSILKSRDITLPTKVYLVKGKVFPVVMYGCEIWTIKKAEHQRIDAFELWCWRRLLRVPWTARRSNQSILKEVSPEYSLEGWMPKLKLQYFGHLIWRASSLEKTVMLGKTEGSRRSGRQRMRWLEGITDPLDEFEHTPGIGIQGSLSCCSQWGLRVRHDWATKLNWTKWRKIDIFNYQHGFYYLSWYCTMLVFNENVRAFNLYVKSSTSYKLVWELVHSCVFHSYQKSGNSTKVTQPFLFHFFFFFIYFNFFVWKYKKPQIAKAVLRKKNGTGGINLPGFRLFHFLIHADFPYSFSIWLLMSEKKMERKGNYRLLFL